ncbi:MAG: family 16 glycoside hydrolase, partial [Tannerellaceae bacterium]
MNTLIKSLFLGSVLFASTSVSAQKVELFNGKNLNNWNFFLDTKSTAKPAEIFSVEDGVITIKGTPFGYMYTKEMYDNFHL